VLLKAFATQRFAPSKAIASGTLPTAKVPRLVPSLAREFGHAAANVVRHPHVRPVKGYSITVFSD
jgi:hypothetical protein